VLAIIATVNNMKVRDSGMPEEESWSKFFDPKLILQQMELNSDLNSVVDLGCGFGTFTIPASQMIKGKIQAIDIDSDMIRQLQIKIVRMEIKNIELHLKDFIAEGTGFPDNSIDYVMLFNILHHDKPHQILNEVHRILKPGQNAGIIHWRSDIPTPRGPHLDIRPTPVQCAQWAVESGFDIIKELILEPYHFGIIISKI
jgi:ubiquinone/menaquinone biosynthesis C-methylase UbiE